MVTAVQQLGKEVPCEMRPLVEVVDVEAVGGHGQAARQHQVNGGREVGQTGQVAGEQLQRGGGRLEE